MSKYLNSTTNTVEIVMMMISSYKHADVFHISALYSNQIKMSSDIFIICISISTAVINYVDMLNMSLPQNKMHKTLGSCL